MHLCYLDEAGDATVLGSATAEVQPVHVIVGLFIASHELVDLTHDFLHLKRETYAHLSGTIDSTHDLNWALAEIKGADVRSDWVSQEQSRSDRAYELLSGTFDILAGVHARIVGKILIKGVGVPIDETNLYTSTTQYISQWFNRYLSGTNSQGIVIADSRSKAKNVNLAHSIFTQKYKRSGDQYGRIIEMPVFGNSANHVGIQIADLLCSALLFPIAALTYCREHVTNQYVHKGFGELKRLFAKRLQRIQFVERDEIGVQGGLGVNDLLARRHIGYLFGDVAGSRGVADAGSAEG